MARKRSGCMPIWLAHVIIFCYRKPLLSALIAAIIGAFILARLGYRLF